MKDKARFLYFAGGVIIFAAGFQIVWSVLIGAPLLAIVGAVCAGVAFRCCRMNGRMMR